MKRLPLVHRLIITVLSVLLALGQSIGLVILPAIFVLCFVPALPVLLLLAHLESRLPAGLNNCREAVGGALYCAVVMAIQNPPALISRLQRRLTSLWQ